MSAPSRTPFPGRRLLPALKGQVSAAAQTDHDQGFAPLHFACVKE